MDQWWGQIEMAVDESRFWRIGPLDLWVYRRSQEWRFASEVSGDALSNELILATTPGREPGEEAESVRFGFRQSQSPLTFLPAVADRSIVVKPETPFLIPSKEQFTLYVSTPVWLQVRVANGNEVLHERPIHRPTDTWFGPSTLEGELCYGSRTSARFHLTNVPRRPHRAVTPVLIHNRASRVLALERLKLPVPRLSIYAAADSHLWTETVRLDRNEDGEHASISVDKGPPKEATGADRLSPPRVVDDRNLLDHTFGLLGFRGRGNDRVAE